MTTTDLTRLEELERRHATVPNVDFESGRSSAFREAHADRAWLISQVREADAAVTAHLEMVDGLRGRQEGYAAGAVAMEADRDAWKARAEAAEAQVREARDRALEEAARVVEESKMPNHSAGYLPGWNTEMACIAINIRALKSAPPASPADTTPEEKK